MAVDRDKISQAAQKLAEKRQFAKAIAELQKLVAEDPKDVRTLLRIGDLFLKDEQPVEAITTYERVGEFYSAQGFALKAIAVYKQIREIIHKHVPHLEDRFGHVVPRLAEIYAQLGLTSDALAAYDDVATRLQRAGRDRDAIDIFKKVVDLDPQNPLPHLRLGEAFVRVKNFDSAIERFGAAADILVKLGRRDDALRVVDRLLQHRQDTRFARMAAEIYLERGGPNDGMAALTKLQICFKDNPKDLETLALLARAFDALGQPSKSVEVQKEAARIAKEAGKTEAFEGLLTQLLARAPNDEGVRQLVAVRAAAHPRQQTIAPASDTRASIDVELEEELLEEDIEEPVGSEKPFVMRPSYASIAPAELDPAARVRQALGQADWYRRSREYDLAIAVLVEAIDAQPAARELRERLCDVLLEAGDQPEAVRQMLAYARWLIPAPDVQAAARVLDEVLLLEPAQPDALMMLGDLGYHVEGQVYEEPAPAPAARPQGPGYDPNAPLPSYDLEEVSASDALSLDPGRFAPQALPPSARESLHAEAVSAARASIPSAHPLSVAPPRASAPPPLSRPAVEAPAASRSQFQQAQLDDPFGADDAPLPSFPIEDEATQFMQLPAAFLAQREREREAEEAASRAPLSSQGPAQLDEEALEEVEFFASHGMFDEAKNLLEEQIARLPNHPLLLERRRELQMMASGGGDGSGTRAVPREASQPEDRSFDIAASLDALDALDSGSGEIPAPSLADDPRQISVETVFEQFKAGVAAQISESDAGTHYDLGVAYREMGLYTDAINEFELASRDPSRSCVCQSMIGFIWRQLGNVEAAVDAFLRGLTSSQKNREQEMLLLYEIGDAYESWQAPEQAYYYFSQLARVEPGYIDPRGNVADRVRRVEPAAPKPAARAVIAEPMNDEFDAALDDLLDGTFPGGSG